MKIRIAPTNNILLLLSGAADGYFFSNESTTAWVTFGIGWLLFGWYCWRLYLLRNPRTPKEVLKSVREYTDPLFDVMRKYPGAIQIREGSALGPYFSVDLSKLDPE